MWGYYDSCRVACRMQNMDAIGLETTSGPSVDGDCVKCKSFVMHRYAVLVFMFIKCSRRDSMRNL